MDAHHRESNETSVLSIITPAIVSSLRRYAKSVGKNILVYQEWTVKSLAVLVPIHPTRERYWLLVVITSDRRWPWPPSMLSRKIASALKYVQLWLKEESRDRPGLTIDMATVIVVAALTRGCYASGSVRVFDMIGDLWKGLWPELVEARLFTRDIRWIVRALRNLRRNLIRELYESIDEFYERWEAKLMREISRFLIAAARMFEVRLQALKESCKRKGVDRPYGEVGELALMFSTLIDHLRIAAWHYAPTVHMG